MNRKNVIKIKKFKLLKQLIVHNFQIKILKLFICQLNRFQSTIKFVDLHRRTNDFIKNVIFEQFDDMLKQLYEQIFNNRKQFENVEIEYE